MPWILMATLVIKVTPLSPCSIEDHQENATDLTDRPRSLKITSTP
jgi:hypothetical protein